MDLGRQIRLRQRVWREPGRENRLQIHRELAVGGSFDEAWGNDGGTSQEKKEMVRTARSINCRNPWVPKS